MYLTHGVIGLGSSRCKNIPCTGVADVRIWEWHLRAVRWACALTINTIGHVLKNPNPTRRVAGVMEVEGEDVARLVPTPGPSTFLASGNAQWARLWGCFALGFAVCALAASIIRSSPTVPPPRPDMSYVSRHHRGTIGPAAPLDPSPPPSLISRASAPPPPPPLPQDELIASPPLLPPAQPPSSAPYSPAAAVADGLLRLRADTEGWKDKIARCGLRPKSGFGKLPASHHDYVLQRDLLVSLPQMVRAAHDAFEARSSLSAAPWMSHHEYLLLAGYLPRDGKMLEWGSGGSTILNSAFVKELWSVEHNRQWCGQVQCLLRALNITNVRYVCSPVDKGHLGWKGGFTEGTRAQFLDYVEMVHRFNQTWDAVLVDGRARVDCAREVVPYLSRKGSTVALHDFWNRPHYKSVLQLYREAGSVKHGQTIVVMAPKSPGSWAHMPGGIEAFRRPPLLPPLVSQDSSEVFVVESPSGQI